MIQSMITSKTGMSAINASIKMRHTKIFLFAAHFAIIVMRVGLLASPSIETFRVEYNPNECDLLGSSRAQVLKRTGTHQ